MNKFRSILTGTQRYAETPQRLAEKKGNIFFSAKLRVISVALCVPLLVLLLAACGGGAAEGETTSTAAPPNGNQTGSGMGRGMDGMGGLMERHRADVPEAYAGLTNPIAATDESLARGAEIYNRLCASCHGDEGMGDGPAAANLDPAPAPIARTGRMLGDDYLFWRVTEGGHEFNTAMPAWDQALTEQERWDVINYVRALGEGSMMPGSGMNGAAFDPTVEAGQRAEMLDQAVADDVITRAEADTFAAVHAQVDGRMGRGRGNMRGGMGQMQIRILAELVAAEQISQEEADLFNDVHDRLIAAGLMQ